MEAIKDNKNVFLKLSNNEAFVLLEWLAKFNQKEHPLLFEDQAEERILFDIESSLEKIMSEPFKENYLESLSRARQEIRDKE
ncbi:MAG: hypothetical protein J7539_16175 [Niabella sp.]|nr:hypothetical protein [Niabella sp.]